MKDRCHKFVTTTFSNFPQVVFVKNVLLHLVQVDVSYSENKCKFDNIFAEKALNNVICELL